MHLKCILITLCVLFFAPGIKAQEVISTGGGIYVTTGGSISYTIGETVTETFSGSSHVLTQGFQQSIISVTEIKEYEGLGFEIVAYPNPTRNYVILFIGKEDKTGLYFQLYDINGKLIIQNLIVDSETKVPFDGLPAGEYFLQVTVENKEVKSFKIVKSE